MSLFTTLAILAISALCLTVEKLRVRPAALTVAKVAVQQFLYLLGGILLIGACTGVAFLAALALPYVLMAVGAAAVLAVVVAAIVGTYHVVNFLAITAGKAAVLLGRVIVEVPLRTMAAIGKPIHAMFNYLEREYASMVDSIDTKRAMLAHRIQEMRDNREKAKAEAEAERVLKIRQDCGYFDVMQELADVKAQLAAQSLQAEVEVLKGLLAEVTTSRSIVLDQCDVLAERNVILEDQGVVLDALVQEQCDQIDNLSSLVRMFASSNQSVRAVNLIAHYLDIRPVGEVKGRTKTVVIKEIRAKASTQQA